MGQEDGRLDHVFQAKPGGTQDRLQILEDLLGLVGELPANQFAGSRVNPDLPAGVNEITDFDRLAVRPQGCRGAIGMDKFLACHGTVTFLVV